MSVKYYKINGVWNTYSYWHYHYGYTTVPSNAVGFKSCAYATFGQDVDPGYYIEGSIPGFLNWSMWAANSEYAWYNTQMMAVQNHRYPSVAESMEMTDGTVTSPAAMYDDDGSIYYLIRDDMADGWLTEEEATERGWSIVVSGDRVGGIISDTKDTSIRMDDFGGFVEADSGVLFGMEWNLGGIVSLFVPIELPTVSLTDDFGTYGSLDLAKYNWLCPDGVTVDSNNNSLVPITMSPMLAKNGLGSYRGSLNEYLIETTPHSYDSTKSYAVLEWQTTMGTTAGRAELMVINLDGNIGIMSISAVDISVTHARIAVCSDPSAENVTVQDANGAFYNAFKYTDENSNVYYYVLDGIQTDWTDDLSSLGYTETEYYTEVSLYLKSSGYTNPETNVVSTRTAGPNSSYLYDLWSDSGRTTLFKYNHSFDYVFGYYYNDLWYTYVGNISQMPATNTSSQSDYTNGMIPYDKLGNYLSAWFCTNRTSTSGNSRIMSLKVRATPKRKQRFAFYLQSGPSAYDYRTAENSNRELPVYSCFAINQNADQAFGYFLMNDVTMSLLNTVGAPGNITGDSTRFEFSLTNNLLNAYFLSTGVSDSLRLRYVLFNFSRYVHVAMVSAVGDVFSSTGSAYALWDLANNPIKYESNVNYKVLALWRFDGRSYYNISSSNPFAYLGNFYEGLPNQLAIKQETGMKYYFYYVWYIKEYNQHKMPIVGAIDWLFTSSGSTDTVSAGSTASMMDRSSASYAYDSNKVYAAISYYDGSSTLNPCEIFAPVNDSGNIGAKNISSSSQNIRSIKLLFCDTTQASVTVVLNTTSNVKYNAFKYTLDGTNYYYILDNIHLNWVSDLSGIGYEEQSGPVLPTVSLSGDFGTNNWLYVRTDLSYKTIQPDGTEQLHLNHSSSDTIPYDETKSYGVVHMIKNSSYGQGDKFSVSIVNYFNTIGVKNITSSAIDAYGFIVAICSSNLATIVKVYKISDNVGYYAFKYTNDGTDYYYVLDISMSERNWTDDLESIGYHLPLQLPTVTLIGTGYGIQGQPGSTSVNPNASTTSLRMWYNDGFNGDNLSRDASYAYALYKYSNGNGQLLNPCGIFVVDWSNDLLCVKNITPSTVQFYSAKVATCDSAVAVVVSVRNSSNVTYNAFKYTADGTDYYYVLDGTQSNWVSDLSSIGYILPPTLELVLCLVASGNPQPVTFGANDYWYASLLSNEDKDKYIAMGGQVISQGTYGLLKYSSDFRYELLALYAGNGENPVPFDQSNFYINGTGGGYSGAVIIHSIAAFSTQIQTWKCLVQQKLSITY